jgi:hypothetical protein
MTLKDLQKAVQSLAGPEHDQLLLRLKDKPFWIWDRDGHKQADRASKGDCCLNHIIGLPTKDGVRKPMFDYERQIYKALLEPGFFNSIAAMHSDDPNNIAHRFKLKHLWVKKATGLGVTEFMLRFMAWLCLRYDDYRNSQMVIVTGPNQELAIKLIKRMKALFANLGITFDSKETVLELNGCTIEAYPSNHIDAFRSLTNPKFILIDEGDFFRKNEQEDVRHVAERYIAKSDPFIVMVSTPNAPGGLFEKIEKEPFDTCIYKKLFLDYTYGLNRIYTREEIDKARMSPGFEREYMLKYQGPIGNIFSQTSIDNALRTKYNPLEINPNAKKSIGIDPGFGSSNFAIGTTQLADGKIQVIHAEEYGRPDLSEMISEIWQLKQLFGYISNIYVDAANPVVWQALKREVDEPFDEKTIREKKAYAMKYNLHIEDQMRIVPVPFAIEGAKMLQNVKWLLEEKDEDGSSLLAIDRERFHKLVTALKTAYAIEYRLDKEQTSYNDILDAFRLSLQFYKRSKA